MRNIDTQYLELCERIANLEMHTQYLQARLDDELNRRRMLENIVLATCALKAS